MQINCLHVFRVVPPKVEWGRQLGPDGEDDEDEESDDSGPNMTGVVRKKERSEEEVIETDLDFEDPQELGFEDFETL